jgi:hypothetical protein
MRIELGSGGKIVGTRRVSPNGQVSGLKEFAGQEVLVVIPGEAEKGFTGPDDYLKDLESVIQEQVRHSLDQYLALQKVYTAPLETAKTLLESRKPKGERKATPKEEDSK